MFNYRLAAAVDFSIAPRLDVDRGHRTLKLHDHEASTSFSVLSNFSQSNERSQNRRRKSWDMVETGIIGKRSPSYFKSGSVDDDISTVINNEPPKFEAAPPPLSPYAAVSPRSPRSHHSKGSPPFKQHFTFSTSSKSASGEVEENESLLDDVSFQSVFNNIELWLKNLDQFCEYRRSNI